MNMKYLLYTDGLFMAQYYHLNNYELLQISNIFEKMSPKKGKVTKRSIQNYISFSDDLTRLVLERFSNEISFSDFFWTVTTVSFIPFSHLLKILLYASRLFTSRPLTFIQFCQFCAQTGVTFSLGEISYLYSKIVGSTDDHITYSQIIELDKSNPKFFRSLKISVMKYRVMFYTMKTYNIILKRFIKFDSIKTYRESHNGNCPPQCCLKYLFAPYNQYLYDYSLESHDLATSLGIHLDQVCYSYLSKFRIENLTHNGVISIGTGISNLCYRHKSSKYGLRAKQISSIGNGGGDSCDNHYSLSSLSTNSNFLNTTPLQQCLLPPPLTQEENSSILLLNHKKSQVAQYPQSLRSVSDTNANNTTVNMNNNFTVAINSRTGTNTNTTNTTISLSNTSSPICTPTQIVPTVPGLVPTSSGGYVSKYKRCSLEMRTLQHQQQMKLKQKT